MKKILVGSAIGAVVGGVVYMLYKQGKLDGVCHDMNKMALKGKRDFKNAVAKGKNHAEYLKDRVEYEFQNGKEKITHHD